MGVVGYKGIVLDIDGENDICMLKESGCGVAMGNSQDTVKRSADIVIGDNDFESLSEYLDWEFLGKGRNRMKMK